jgi:hypothetical protein
MKQFIPAGLGVASILAIITCSAVHVSSCKNAPASDSTRVKALTFHERPVVWGPLDSGKNVGGGTGGTPKAILTCIADACGLLGASPVTSEGPSSGSVYAVEVKALQAIPANSTFRLEFRIVSDSSGLKTGAIQTK